MFKLSVKLPPFSPDYSGVCSALFDLGGLVVIHDASGCTGNYTGYDEPRWYGSSSMVYCSNLREIDAVMGDDEKLIRKITDVAKEMNPAFIAVLGSPVPMVIGTDMKGIAAELEANTGIKSFGFSTRGLSYYDEGAASAFIEIAKHYSESMPKKPRSINILGSIPLDFGMNGDIPAVKQIVKGSGFDIISDFAMGGNLKDIANSGSAALNLVISSSGVPLAEWFKNTYGTPWVAGVPVGSKTLDGFTGMLESGAHSPKTRSGGGNVLVIHDQIIANSIRDCLEADFGLRGIDVATPFSFHPELASAGDSSVKSEGEIHKLINGGYSVIIGDPLFGELLKPASGVKYIPLPHPAVSSRLHWQETPNIAGSAAVEFFSKYL